MIPWPGIKNNKKNSPYFITDNGLLSPKKQLILLNFLTNIMTLIKEKN